MDAFLVGEGVEAYASSSADPSGPLHINGVIPPDEFHFGDDSVYTNAVARLNLRFAVSAAEALGHGNEPLVATWRDAEPRIVMLFNKSSKVHPEFAQYKGDQIKQADVILLGYPLGLATEPFGNVTAESRQADLSYYDPRTSPSGPAMTWGMVALSQVELGMIEEAEYNLNRSFQLNTRAPFCTWTETPSGGCPDFLTGAGGFLQGVTFGYPRLRIADGRLELRPVLLPGSDKMVIRGAHYLGSVLDLTVVRSGSETQLQVGVRATAALGTTPASHPDASDSLLAASRADEVFAD